MKPYTEIRSSNTITRTFSVDCNESELVWHRDHTDRYVEILEGNGWRFQMDNDLPIILQPGDTLAIPKNTYHRILKGTTDLVVEIVER